jgi:hypothetical protein
LRKSIQGSGLRFIAKRNAKSVAKNVGHDDQKLDIDPSLGGGTMSNS